MIDGNPHLELWATENHVSDGERAWLCWANRVERNLGHSLDGNQITDGYSQDFAYDAFTAGMSVEDHAAEIRANPLYVAAAAKFPGRVTTS
jgi:hypothetical protein